MMSDNQHAVTPAFGLKVILRELRSQSAFEIARGPTLAAMLDFNCHFARGGGRGDDDVRLIAYGDLGFTESMKAATRACIHLFDEPVLDFVFISCAFQQWARRHIAMCEVLCDVGKDAHDDAKQICTRFRRRGELALKC